MTLVLHIIVTVSEHATTYRALVVLCLFWCVDKVEASLNSIQVNGLHVNSRQVDKNNLSICHSNVCITQCTYIYWAPNCIVEFSLPLCRSWFSSVSEGTRWEVWHTSELAPTIHLHVKISLLLSTQHWYNTQAIIKKYGQQEWAVLNGYSK